MPAAPHRTRLTALAVVAVLGAGAAAVATTGGSAVASYPAPGAAARLAATEVGGFVTGPLGVRVDGVLVRAYPAGAPAGAAPVASALTYEKPDGPDRGTEPDAAHGWYALALPPGDYRITYSSSPGTRPFVPEDYPSTVTVGSTAVRLQTVALEDADPNPAPTATTPPSIRGEREVGEDLVAEPGTWTIDGWVPSYAWTADGQPLAVDGPELVLTRDLAGRKVAVSVTVARPGWLPGTATSAPVQVRRLSTRIGGELDREVLRPGERARVDLAVSPRTVTGGWEVVVDGRAVASGTFGPRDRGEAAVLLPALPRGRHDVRVDYLGDRAHAPSSDEVGDVVVRRRR